jgi:hypothetical protein
MLFFSSSVFGNWRRPGQNRVTWKTPSSRAFVSLQEPVAVLPSYVPHKPTRKCGMKQYTTFISCRSRSCDKQAVDNINNNHEHNM